VNVVCPTGGARHRHAGTNSANGARLDYHPTMARGWAEFVDAAAPGGHAVQVYQDVGELAESVAAYLVAGFESADPSLVVAVPEHWNRLTEELARSGWAADHLERHGLLVQADAEATLDAFMEDGRPSAAGFERVVGPLLDRLESRHPGHRVRVFGEMVDLLFLRGEPRAALALEKLWNDLARGRDFALLCGYQLDVFDRASQVEALPGVCDAHTHVRPAADPALFARAVDRALDEVLGTAAAGRVYFLIGDDVREDRVPVAQLALMWVSAHMPSLADRVLAAARAHYAAPAASAAL
jgi:hypothetical protein